MRPTIGTCCAVRRDNERRDIDFGIRTTESNSAKRCAIDVLITTAINGNSTASDEITTTMNEHSLRIVCQGENAIGAACCFGCRYAFGRDNGACLEGRGGYR